MEGTLSAALGTTCSAPASAIVLLQPLVETGNYQVAVFDGAFEPVPEPSTIVLFGLGVVILTARSTTAECSYQRVYGEGLIEAA